MRLTVVLRRQHMKRFWNDLWERKGKFPATPPQIPKVLQEKGVTVIDPTEKAPLPRWNPPVEDPRFYKPIPVEERPDYHEEQAYIAMPHTRLIEGVKQACILTKSECRTGFPPSVHELIGQVEIPNQDLLLQRYIMQAHVWDPTQEKLPKRIDTSKVGWKFNREYGIPRGRSATMLMKNMLRLCQTLAGRYPSIANDFRLIYKPYLGTHYYYKDKLINIQGLSEWLLSSRNPLLPFADVDEVDGTAAKPLDTIYPIFPTIDLLKEHCYSVQNQTGFVKECSHSHPHTIFVSHHNYWTNDQRQAKCLLFAFGYAVANARKRFGDRIQTLPEPISVQCVNMDETSINFLFFQLNTLNFGSDDGVKNIAWVDSGNVLFEKHLPKPWLGPEHETLRLDNYDPKPFHKVLAVFVNGAEGVST
ncbi:39S ribosomal protein L37, mitochondrial-like [Gigantopelta aegis]|uniref:39S ribosomal protein L37, mitochondrial-like n=1 Tax=Gigantopelta aegis TaxID=1735272 RepID=UPI001B88912A|nr:39S ribosomal protein L37, mitochondrial-like [Gigantopelta aegis]